MKRTKFIHSIGAALAFAAFAFAGAACQKEHVRVVSVQNPDARRVGIGFIENRDIRYSPFSSKNFSDMLSFELMQNGYRLSDVDFATLRESSGEKSGDVKTEKSPANQGAGESEGTTPAAGGDEAGEAQDTRDAADEANEQDAADRPAGEGEASASEAESEIDRIVREAEADTDEESYADAILPEKAGQEPSDRVVDPAAINDGTRDLLPLRLRTIAGELQPQERVVDPEDRRLTGGEIARIARSNGLDYYIQGAIGRTETGLILETEQNTLVFLEVFDPRGERVGAINISVNDETLKRSSFLQQISAEIIQAFDREIGR